MCSRLECDKRDTGKSLPVVVALHLIVEHLALLGCGVGDKLCLDDLQDVLTDVGQLFLDLGLVVADEWKLVALHIQRPRKIEVIKKLHVIPSHGASKRDSIHMNEVGAEAKRTKGRAT